MRYAVEAAGARALNEAENLLSEEIVSMKVKLATIEELQHIIRESVKPMENIDGIKIIQVDGLNGGAVVNGDGSGSGGNGNGAGLADQVVSSALQYRAQAPLIDLILKEVGLSGAILRALLVLRTRLNFRARRLTNLSPQSEALAVAKARSGASSMPLNTVNSFPRITACKSDTYSSPSSE